MIVSAQIVHSKHFVELLETKRALLHRGNFGFVICDIDANLVSTLDFGIFSRCRCVSSRCCDLYLRHFMTVLSLSDISYFSVPRHAESLSVNLYSDMQAVATGGLKRLKALVDPPPPPPIPPIQSLVSHLTCQCPQAHFEVRNLFREFDQK